MKRAATIRAAARGEEAMELLFLGTMALGAYWIARRAGFAISDQTIAVLVRGLRATTASRDWPRGVQEEDRDRPWGRSPHQKAEPEPRPKLSKVRPVIRTG